MERRRAASPGKNKVLKEIRVGIKRPALAYQPTRW
jgi:hypothetical protein